MVSETYALTWPEKSWETKGVAILITATPDIQSVIPTLQLDVRIIEYLVHHIGEGRLSVLYDHVGFIIHDEVI